MFEIAEIVKSLQDLTKRYGLKILYVDFTDVTLISRIGFDRDRTDDLLNAMYFQASLAFYPLFSPVRYTKTIQWKKECLLEEGGYVGFSAKGAGLTVYHYLSLNL